MTKILRNGLIGMMLMIAGFALVLFFRMKMMAE